MKLKKICIITGTRAEYGLLYWLMKEIQEDIDLELQIIATGMHLSPEFGQTWEQIFEDGFTINKKIEMLLSSDTPVGITKSMGVGLIGFAEAYETLKPDIIVVLGDRFEILAAVSAAMVARIPIAHIHGGELTMGAIDDSIRHAITKMSHLHFAAADEYRNRIIQMGEHPKTVFNFGSPALDLIKKIKLLNRDAFQRAINFPLIKKNLIVTYHPVTLENNTSQEQFEELLNALDTLSDTHIIFTKPNADTDGRVIIKMIDDYVKLNSDKAISFVSMGPLLYLSALQFMDAMVGNSSSGLTEAPSFKIGTINIGDRQKGRIKASSVIDCNPTNKSISQALTTLYSNEFQLQLLQVSNPYGQGEASVNIKKILKSIETKRLLKKNFYRIERL